MTRFVFLIGVSLFALSPVLAQDSPDPGAPSDTTQTDQSEEDWRNSQKRGDSDDPFDPNANPNNTGWGINLPPSGPMDQLPEESREHINRERARAIATGNPSDPNEPIPDYTPSDAAQSDPGLARAEQAAWDEIMRDMKGLGSGAGQGQGGSGQGQGSGQGDGQGTGAGGGAGQLGQGRSVIAGGANQSALELLRQMQGLGNGTGTEPGDTGETGQGEAPQGAQSEPSGDAEGQTDGAGQDQGAQNADGEDDSADASSSGSGPDGETGSESGEENAASDDNGAGEDASTDESQSDDGDQARTQSDTADGPQSDSGGSQSSASDYLNGEDTAETQDDSESAAEDTETTAEADAATATTSVSTPPSPATSQPSADITFVWGRTTSDEDRADALKKTVSRGS